VHGVGRVTDALTSLDVTITTWVPRFQVTATPHDRAVGPCLSSYNGPRGKGFTDERGTPVHNASCGPLEKGKMSAASDTPALAIRPID
jgi:hypothetical protein